MARTPNLGGFATISWLINRGIANVQADIDAHKTKNPPSWARRALGGGQGCAQAESRVAGVPAALADPYGQSLPKASTPRGFWDGVKRTARRVFNRGG